MRDAIIQMLIDTYNINYALASDIAGDITGIVEDYYDNE